MTSVGITIHFNPLCREPFKEDRIVNAIKDICRHEQVSCGIGYDELTPLSDKQLKKKMSAEEYKKLIIASY